MELNVRQKQILEIVKQEGPISGEEIAARLNLSRAALRPHLAVLTTSGIIDARPRVGYFYAGNMTNGVSEALKGFTAGDIKSRPIIIREEASVYDAIVTLFIEDVGTLFVVDEQGYLQGVVSRKDFLKSALGGLDFHRIPVGVIMTRMPQIHTVTEDETVLQVARRICENEVDSLPVIRQDKNGCKVLGRVTKTNLARLLMELGEGR
ncbi:MAG: helix-turn-helix transcriptional regulator [Bacillota bacterium]|nr:helix-turn-helix transcriptional regulator [Bacillota bacterium]MDW7683490.1 helix-turn-helix transcriptional regulator [Bacillota bacterium]